MLKTLWLQLKGKIRQTVNENTDLRIAGQEANGKDNVWGIGMYANNKHILDESKWKGQNLLGEVLMKVRQTLRLRTDVDFENTLYAKACELIQTTPDKLSFEQIVKGLNLSANEVDPQAINLALGWASQAHVKYLEDN